MKIEIQRITNGLLVTFTYSPTSNDPLAQRGALQSGGLGTFFAHDGTDLLGYIAERIEAEYGFTEGRKE